MDKHKTPVRPRHQPEPTGGYNQPANPEEAGDMVRVHREVVERRLTGGLPATPQAYARAAAQWQQLPGALVDLSTTDLEQAQATPAPDNPGTPHPPQVAPAAGSTPADIKKDTE
jgi:hypothetical protein